MSGASNNISQHSMAVIKRPQHNIKLASVLNDMLQCGHLVDVTIYCDDGQLNAHKLVLAASSTYFRNLFTRMKNAFHYPIIVLREMPVNDLKSIIQYIYHGEVHVPIDRVDSFRRYADYLQIDGVESSVNAILASSSNMSTSHHTLFTAHSAGGTISAISNINSNTQSNKIHPQYPPSANCKPPRGHSSRSNNSHLNNNIINNSSNNNSDNSTNNKAKHACPICLKGFTHGFTLKRHMKLHSQSRLSIYCDVCSKSYSCKDSYLRHKKSSGHLQHVEFHHRSISLNIGSDR